MTHKALSTSGTGHPQLVFHIGDPSTLLASDAEPGLNCTAFPNSPGLWYKFTGNGNTVTISTCNPATDFDTILQLYEGDCDSLECVATNNNIGGTPIGGIPQECLLNGASRKSRITYISNPGTTYYIFISGIFDAEGIFEFSLPDCVSNDFCADAIPIQCGDAILGSTKYATEIDENGSCTVLDGFNGVWYTFVGNGGSITLSTCHPETDFNTKLQVWTGNCNALNCIVGIDDVVGAPSECNLNGSNYKARLTLSTQNNTMYYLYLCGTYGDYPFGSYKLTMEECVINDICSNAQPIQCGEIKYGSTLFATEIDENGFCGVTDGNAGVWYTFVGDGGTVTFSTCYSETNFNSMLQVWTGSCNALTCVTGIDDVVGAPFECDLNGSNWKARLSLPTQSNTTYYLYVYGSASWGNFKLSRECVGCSLVPDIVSFCVRRKQCTGSGPNIIDWTDVPGAISYEFHGEYNNGNNQLNRTVTNSGFSLGGFIPNNFPVMVQLRARCFYGTYGNWTTLIPYIISNSACPSCASTANQPPEPDAPPILSTGLTISGKRSIQLYPNPVKELLHIRLGVGNSYDIAVEMTLTDALGRVLRVIKTTKHLIQLDVSDLQAGIYLISIRQGKLQWAERFIKLDF